MITYLQRICQYTFYFTYTDTISPAESQREKRGTFNQRCNNIRKTIFQNGSTFNHAGVTKIKTIPKIATDCVIYFLKKFTLAV